MEKFLQLPIEERTEIIEEAAFKSKLSTVIIEKDLWVCWMLKRLFSIPFLAPHIIFKGGTSLSKAYGLIERFSEDIDLTIDKSLFGNMKDNDNEHLSGKQIERRVDKLMDSARQYLKETVMPAIIKECKLHLNDEENWKLEFKKEDKDGLTIAFYYPTSSISKNNDYIRPVVLLEFGARGDIIPNNERNITPYLFSTFPNLFESPHFMVPTLNPERTFWEKLTILHRLFHKNQIGKRFPERMSRHYYDIYMMANKGIADIALSNTELLTDVVKNTKLYFKDNSASYNTAILGSLKLAPSEDMLPAIEKDYLEMKKMIIGDYPDISLILKDISALEERINNYV